MVGIMPARARGMQKKLIEEYEEPSEIERKIWEMEAALIVLDFYNSKKRLSKDNLFFVKYYQEIFSRARDFLSGKKEQMDSDIKNKYEMLIKKYNHVTGK